MTKVIRPESAARFWRTDKRREERWGAIKSARQQRDTGGAMTKERLEVKSVEAGEWKSLDQIGGGRRIRRDVPGVSTTARAGTSLTINTPLLKALGNPKRISVQVNAIQKALRLHRADSLGYAICRQGLRGHSFGGKFMWGHLGMMPPIGRF